MRIAIPGLAEAKSGFDLLEAGEYPVEVTKIDIKATKDGEGKYLNWQLNITDGDSMGRTLFFTSPITNQAGLGITKAALKAVGYDVPTDFSELDTDELIGLGAVALVDIDNSYDPDNPRNKVKKLIPK